MQLLASIAGPTRDPQTYQEAILLRVSRTFALTIPQLPRPLRRVVTNVYLLCRICDTIEDESALSIEQKQYFHELFMSVIAEGGDPRRFALELAPLLTNDTSEAERELVSQSSAVIAITRTFNANQHAALLHCLGVMCEGMALYERSASIAGLRDQRALDGYCYYVAGVVGETLTALFCDYSDEIARHREVMNQLGVSFGQGLQMVNILKDFWEDHERGVCWLPRQVFDAASVELRDVDSRHYQPGFGAAYSQLISIAHSHLRNGLEYALLIPAREAGIRRFCLLALALAVQTLQLIRRFPAFRCGSDVKVSHRTVANTVLMARLFASYDQALRRWFERLGRDQPLQAIEVHWPRAARH
jgi:farnesyl-diphosphate farnesyltransferase